MRNQILSCIKKTGFKPLLSFVIRLLLFFHSITVAFSAGFIQELKSIEQWVAFSILLVFSVTPFKIDQNKNQNRSIDKVRNLGNERRYIYKDPRLDSGQRNISYTRYLKKCFTQIYRDLYGSIRLATHDFRTCFTLSRVDNWFFTGIPSLASLNKRVTR